jgi:hypothetical protein
VCVCVYTHTGDLVIVREFEVDFYTL